MHTHTPGTREVKPIGNLLKQDTEARTTRVSRYQRGKTNLEFTEARHIDWQWHQLGYRQL